MFLPAKWIYYRKVLYFSDSEELSYLLKEGLFSLKILGFLVHEMKGKKWDEMYLSPKR